MAGNYSKIIWVNWEHDATSQIIIGRYEVSVSGWELYFTESGAIDYLTLRHHHAGGASLRTAVSSVGWVPGTWFCVGISRVGGVCKMYRNGTEIVATGDTLIDPETCTQDVTIATRYTKNANWYKGYLSRPRIWNRALTDLEFKTIYELDKRWFP